MNDQELDAQLRQLFDAETISVDAKGEAAAALFEDIVGTTGQADRVPGRWVSPQPAHNESSATDLVVDLRRGAGPHTAELDSTRRLRRRITVAAILALVVILAANVLLTQQDASSPVISEDGTAAVEDDDDVEQERGAGQDGEGEGTVLDPIVPSTVGTESDVERILEEEEALVDAAQSELASAALVDAARALFADGVNRDELQDLWDGYPYGADERDERIEAFLTDFAWMTGETEVEVNLYEQFEGSGFVVPVVTVWPTGEPERAAVFVLGGTADDLRIGRIPEAGDGLLAHSLNERLDGTDTTIVIDRVGIEGGVSAYLGELELETVVDPIEFTTAISLPDDRPANTVVTIVSATPEVPGAAVLVVP